MNAQLLGQACERQVSRAPIRIQGHVATLAICAGQVKAISASDRACAVGHTGQVNRLKEILDARGMKAADLAKRTNNQASTISKLTRGKRELRQHWAALFAPVLKVRPQDLLAPVGDPIPPETEAGAGIETAAPAVAAPVETHPVAALAQLIRTRAKDAIGAAGPRLRATREALGIRTAAELASEIGATEDDVVRWESGLTPDLAALAVLSVRRNVPLDWLLLGDARLLPPVLLHALVSHGHAGLAYRGGAMRGHLPDPMDIPGGRLHEPGQGGFAEAQVRPPEPPTGVRKRTKPPAR